jgi:CheY-like chemotaxis protein
MSHELRTPLNSLLILAQQLRDNPEGNLTEKQVEFARTIFSSGNDLLSLINEILDLSKIESGTVSLDISDLQFKSLQHQLERMFRHVADNKKLSFTIELDPNLPNDIYTDVKRVNQVLNNLLSNSFKFTSEGSVSIKIGTVAAGWSPENKKLNDAKEVIAFSVKDTGIGIPQDKLKIIFEAFQQADSGTARKFGGTGLGLAISREIATMLGGELTVESEVGKGSVFTLYLPNKYEADSAPVKGENGHTLHEMESIANAPGAARALEAAARTEPAVTPSALSAPSAIPDDRDILEPGDDCLLIIEDDLNFARILLDIAHERKFKVIVATTGNEAITLATRYTPCAITLDIGLPDMSGWKAFDILKTIFSTAHIPVYVICMKGTAESGFNRGEAGILEKPVTREELNSFFGKIVDFNRSKVRTLLLMDAESEVQVLQSLLGTEHVTIRQTPALGEALNVLTSTRVDCVMINPDQQGLAMEDAIEKIRSNPDWAFIPIIIHSNRTLSVKEEKFLSKYKRIKLISGPKTRDQLLYYTSLYMHLNTAFLPPERAKSLDLLYQAHSPLAGKKVLIVDDDMRNIFALTALLERFRMVTIPAESGAAALRIIRETPDISAVLMDIMMPEMDGYQTMQEIRKIPEFKSLQIIALTAKAMKGDREKCIEAGANEYISKPVDSEKLLILLRQILYS